MSAHLISSIRRYHAHYAGLSATCWQGILLSLFESALTGTYYFLQLYFINELKISITTAGLIMSFYGIGTILGGFVGGKLSDKMSSGLVATISILIQGVTLLAIIKIQSAPFLMMDLFLMGLACYSFITANHIWVLDKCDQEFQKLKAINILNSASNLGFGLSAAMIGFCLDYGFHEL
jgi:predicted MFS family arabinose efflux permease